MVNSWLRFFSRTGYTVLIYPLHVFIERLFVKNGAGLGTALLTFIFINGNWVLLFLGIWIGEAMRAVYPALAGLGAELVLSVLLMLGNFFYAFPLGGMALLVYLLASPDLRASHKNQFPVYRLLEYLCTVAPVAVWVFTFFSYRMLAGFHQLPAGGKGSFFLPVNFRSYFEIYFPVLHGRLDWGRPGFYFSLWGFISGLAGGLNFLRREVLSNRAFRREAVRDGLFGEHPCGETHQRFQLAGVYVLLVLGLIVWPGGSHSRENGERVIRLLSVLFLLLPVWFQIGLFIRLQRRNIKPGS